MAIRKPLALDLTYGTPSEMSSTMDTLTIGQVSAQGIGGVSIDCNGGSIANLATPINPSDGVCKSYVDAIAAGLSVKMSVKALSASNVASLSGATTIDNVAVGAGDRVLLTGQTTASANGIWIVQSGAWTRPKDFAVGSSAAGAYTFIDGNDSDGVSKFAEQGWICTNTPGSDIVGTSPLSFTQFSGLGEVTTTNGLTKDGNTISILLATNPGLQFTGGALDTFLTPGGSLSKSATGLQVQLNGMTLGSSAAGLSVLGVPLQFNVGAAAVSNLVTAPNLSALVAGPTSSVDTLHQHTRVLNAKVVSDIHTNGTAPLAAGDPVQWSATSYTLARCDAANIATSQCIGIAATAIAANATGVIIKRGVATGIVSGATPGTPYFLSAGGGLSAGFPVGSAVAVVRLGHACGTDAIDINPAQIGQRSAN